MEKIKGRFAPSPSGRMHLGNAFCALLAWLACRSAGGMMTLRVEDLDPERCRPTYAWRLMEDLEWMGLDWDQGPRPGQPPDRYWQSQRGEIYGRALEKLREQGLLYPCFCTRAELHAAQAPHAADGLFVYDGRCRSLSPERRRELAQKRKPAVRLQVPAERIEFFDGCQGLCGQDLQTECGDFILRRSDGAWAYQLAVVCDDGAMGVNQVVRGRDLLSSTPRQLLLYRLIGLKPPQFYHIPLLLSAEGRRLSKRDGDLDLGALREKRTAEELTGYLAWLAGLLERPEPASPGQLLPLFDWGKIPRQDIRLPKGLFAEK
ncbi:MAG: tRNA glutamyl-Q(34) synthetase GluQRS [Clostridiaceae bacterium]|jgi:glutamyl-tRNA synthetase|nr:tRNA glutamyl-Q(34) synthetase GluQRS [Clostridiaceae bacterium]